MMWDGLGFFGFATSKLGRLKGEPVTWCTQLKNCQFVTLTLLTFGITIYIIATEAVKLGSQKSSTITLMENPDYSFNVREQFTMHIGQWLYVDEVIPQIQAF